MTPKPKSVSQPIRFLYLIVYLGFLFMINRIAFDQWMPLTTPKGLWFFTGAAALVLGSQLVTPFFTSPAAAISYLVAALVGVFAFDAASPNLEDTVPRNVIIYFCFGMLAVCALNIIFKDSKSRSLRNMSEAARILADNLGSPRFVFSLVIVYSLWEYHRANPAELFFIGVAGIVIAAQQPLETFGNVIKRTREVWIPTEAPSVVGCMIAHQSPDLLLIRQDGTETISPGSCLLVADEHAPLKIGVALGYFGRDEGILLRALEIAVPDNHRARLLELSKRIPAGGASLLDPTEINIFQDEVYLLRNLNCFIGIVAQETSTEKLYFEVIQEKDIEQGRLVETFVFCQGT